MALEALVSYYRAMEADVPDMTATVTLGEQADRHRGVQGTIDDGSGSPDGDGRPGRQPDRAVTGSDDLADRHRPAVLHRASAVTAPAAGRVARSRHSRRAPLRALRQRRRSTPASTSFARGDVVRVTVTVIVPKESRFLAVTDAVAAGFEPIEGWFQTTASDLARDATVRGGRRHWLDRDAPRRLRSHREARRPRARVRDAAGRRPARVLLPRARDDVRRVPRRRARGSRPCTRRRSPGAARRPPSR